jgi:general secretion pathway protein G
VKRPRCSRRTRRHGFSLIELLIALALLAVLGTVAVPMAELVHQRRQEQALADALRDIRRAIDAYRDAVDEGRITRPVGTSGFPPDLKALVDGVPDEKSADRRPIYFLRSLPRDPMATDATLPADETWALRSHASPPDDPRPGADVFDVRSRAAGTGLNGIPYREW